MIAIAPIAPLASPGAAIQIGGEGAEIHDELGFVSPGLDPKRGSINPVSPTPQGYRPMQLLYRGATYQLSPAEPTDLDAIGTYRGKVFIISAPVDRVATRSQRLTYRGIDY